MTNDEIKLETIKEFNRTLISIKENRKLSKRFYNIPILDRNLLQKIPRKTTTDRNFLQEIPRKNIKISKIEEEKEKLIANFVFLISSIGYSLMYLLFCL